MRTARGIEIDGRYRLSEPVGRGGMATVWRARDLRLGRDVAIKILAEGRADEQGFVERFEREAQIAARLSHPNLVSIHDLGFDGGRPYLVMEFIEGETLNGRLQRAPESVDPIALARTLLGVLAAIHEAGIVHRDVKPANVLFEDDGRIRLTDFGIARIIGSSSITKSNEVIGTARYMAPEVRDGAEPSPAADLYALGVLLAECGATDGPLQTLVRRLRSPDASRRPASARLALLSIAGADAAADDAPAGRPPTEVLAERPRPLPPSLRSDPSATAAAGRERRPARGRLQLAGLAGLLAIVAVGAVLLGGSGSGPGDGRDSRQASSTTGDADGSRQARSGRDDKGGAQEKPATRSDSSQAARAVPADVEPDPAAGVELNNQGYALLQQGRAEEAVPLLRRAVASWPEGADDINYAYALYNLGVALRETGHPTEAIPLLRRRLAWNDQRQTVRSELRLARAEATNE